MIPINSDKIKQTPCFLFILTNLWLYVFAKQNDMLSVNDSKLVNSELLVNMYIFIYQTFSSGSYEL